MVVLGINKGKTMTVKWNDFEKFRYTECGDEPSLFAEVKESLNVVLPGGKAFEVEKGDYLLVDKPGTEVFILEKKSIIKTIQKKVKKTKKRKKYAETQETEETKTETVLIPRLEKDFRNE